VTQRLAGALKHLSGWKPAGQDADYAAHYTTLFPSPVHQSLVIVITETSIPTAGTIQPRSALQHSRPKITNTVLTDMYFSFVEYNNTSTRNS
jgi:hypothetical protein